jgi:tRNA threonylcarbamoyladenosine biosynthesis protein TsaB
MLLLAIDTSTLAGSICLLQDERVIGELSLNLGLKHTERLLPGMDWLFSELKIEPKAVGAIAVGIGPVSFTGLRVGLVSAKGLAMSLGVPIVGVSSLEALALPLKFYGGKILAVLDAKKSQVFAGFYQGGGELVPLGGELVVNPDQLLPMLEDGMLVTGEGFRVYRQLLLSSGKKIIDAGFEFDFPKASSIAKIGLEKIKAGKSDQVDGLAPVYLRPSDAEFSKPEVK